MERVNFDALLDALHRLPRFADVAPADLEPMRVTGLAHDHVSIRGRGILLRVPKQSQFGLDAATNLAYQAACFERVSRSGHAPALHGVIPPSAAIPMGALVVEQIDGRPPRLPEDLFALADCMARIHALPLPSPEARAPLADHRDPVGGALAEIERQAAFLDDASLRPAARAQIRDELAWARRFGQEVGGQPIALVLTDTHPGNFLVDAGDKAVIVDLEKALYGSPATDLAHATLYTSTTWDVASRAAPSIDEIAAFYRRYLHTVTPALGRHLAPWLVPMRRITFLRAITWCVKWDVLHKHSRIADKHRRASTEDWSAENSDAALVAHVADRVSEYLRPQTIERIRAEWSESRPLERLLEGPGPTRPA
ncbi:aminoglycoside phosphotransferase family protein [Rhodospirillaceae bacterium SYSU D60014]|uniref:aminoglycoside phosphotransferase family protein n=1 Tax=Virgifigura deserti TaxID=2268457 RepID=UPI000E66A057